MQIFKKVIFHSKLFISIFITSLIIFWLFSIAEPNDNESGNIQQETLENKKDVVEDKIEPKPGMDIIEKEDYLKSPFMGIDMDNFSEGLRKLKPESNRFKLNFSIETIGAINFVDFEDTESKLMGAWDYTSSFNLQRVHREWEPTYLLPRPVNIFPVMEDSAVTTRYRFSIYYDPVKDWTIGFENDVYNLTGTEEVGYIWGVTPSFFSNPYQGHFATFTMNKAWIRNQPTNTQLTFGAFTPNYIGDYILKGQPNVFYSSPEYLPFYGVNFVKKFFNPFNVPSLVYEVCLSDLPDASEYRSVTGGGYLGYKSSNLDIGINLGGAFNRGGDGNELSSPLQGNVSDTPIRWESPFDSIGPQNLILSGTDASYNFYEGYKVWLSYGRSIYEPEEKEDKTIHGDLFNIGVAGRLSKLNYTIEGFRVDPTYDPFIIPMKFPEELPGQNLFYELPYFTTYPKSWFLHDTKKYPHNRNGLRFHADLPISTKRSFSRITLDSSFLKQVENSDMNNMTTPGFIEPFFGIRSSSGSGEKGSVKTFGVGFQSDLPANYKSSISYNFYRFEREDSGLDNIDLRIHGASILFGYPILYRMNAKSYFNFGYSIMHTWGEYYSLRDNIDFIQGSPYCNLEYKYVTSPDTTILFWITYKNIAQNDTSDVTLLGDFDANLIYGGIRIDF
ncbi:MAG: hypothetical protein HY999_06305 [Nitrospinae bacterium]|nr:hypothetical protein [Nitrospinota bacterium]